MTAHKHTPITLALLLSTTLFGAQAQATDYYTWTDENGVTQFTDRPVSRASL